MFDVDNFFHSDIIGDSSEIHLDSKNKIKKEWFRNRPQKYIGDILYRSIHGHGFYFVENGKKLFYDGLFYANKLEGYAQVFYDDASNFQGLFKNNNRFGPGVLTYNNGQQDVGLWTEYRLLRLGGLNGVYSIPRLASTPIGQLKLLKFRYLVPICPKREDVAYNVLKKLGANAEVLKKSNQLYNLDVMQKRHIFFNKNLYDQEFYGSQDCCIDIVVSDEEGEEDANIESEAQADLTESPLGKPDVNMERVKQISEGLEIIQSKLCCVKRERSALQQQLEYCRSCCHDPECNAEDDAFENPELKEEKLNITSETKSELPTKCPSETTPKTKNDQDATLHHEDSKSHRASTKSDLSDYSDISGLSVFTSLTFKSGFSEVDSKLNRSLDDIIPEVEPPPDNKTKIDGYDTCQCEEEVQIDNLVEMEQLLEKVLREEAFLNSIRKNLSIKLQEHLRKIGEKSEVKTRKMIVKEVVSWNNERSSMHMLQHSFLHRKSEYMVNFKVSDIIAGNRFMFENPGPHETECQEFLNACASGDKATIFKLIGGNHININVCDAKGNTGIFYAAVNCQSEIMKMLVNLGAKLDAENDEGLRSLNMCLLMYLAKKLNIENWEMAFLPEEKHGEEWEMPCDWYPNTSLLELLENCQKNKPSKVNEKTTYVFDTSYVTDAQIIEVEKGPVRSRVYLDTNSEISLGSIEHSILSLLHFGSDPNTCHVPLPTLFLSLFTGDHNLVHCILEAHANVDATIENDMTALHVMASLKYTPENINICHTLLNHRADASLKTSTNHWLEQKEFILGKDINPDDIEDLGKNALHILCIRKDFNLDKCSYFSKIVNILADSNLDFITKYLGHTPLSLAVLIGNMNLVETLLKLTFVDPYQLLGHNMGNVLTIYILRRYEDRLPPNAAQILKILVDAGVNPLQNVGKFENVFSFMDMEYGVNTGEKDKRQINGEKKGNGEIQTGRQRALMDYIRTLGRETIIKYVQMQAVENLYNFIEGDATGHDSIKMLAQFLTPSVVITNLQHIFKYGRIHSKRFDMSICLKLIDIVETHQVTNPKKEKINSSIPSSKILNYDELNAMDISKLKSKSENKDPPPGLDDLSNYKVCYHCLKKRDKQLMLCPRCQYVYFCSAACNNANLKLKTLHTCNLKFYPSQQEAVESKPSKDPEYLAKLYSRTRESCEERLRNKLKEGLELERQRFREEMKADIYGIKFLRQLKKKSMNRTPTVTTLLGSAMDQINTLDTTLNTLTGRLSISDKFAKTRRSSVSRCSVTDSKTHGQRTHLKKRDDCECLECISYQDSSMKSKCKAEASAAKTTYKNKMLLEGTTDTFKATRKLRTIPKKYKEFIELLTRYFPDVDFSSLFLPYACYSNGHLYYKFLEDNIFTKTYSMM